MNKMNKIAYKNTMWSKSYSKSIKTMQTGNNLMLKNI